MNQEDRNRRPAHRGSASVRKSGAHVRRPVSRRLEGEELEQGRTPRRVTPESERPAHGSAAPQQATERQDRRRIEAEGRRTVQSYDTDRRTSPRGRGDSSDKQKKTGIIAGGIVILIAVAVCIFLILRMSKTENLPDTEQTTQTEETFAPEAIHSKAAIDLSGVPGLSKADTDAAGQDAEISTAGDKSENSEKNSGDAVLKDDAQSSAEGNSASTEGKASETLLYIQGMTPDEIRAEISSRYTWSMAVINEQAEVGTTVKPTVDANETTEAATMGDAENPDSGGVGEADETAAAVTSITVADQIAVPDQIKKQLDALLEEIVAADEKDPSVVYVSESSDGSDGSDTPEASSDTEAEPVTVYKLELGDVQAAAQEVAKEADSMWHKTAKGGSIGSYDKASDSFKMEGAKDGYEVDRDALAAKIEAAVAGGDYTARIPVVGETVKANAEANLAAYKIIGTFTTKTTANKVRNKNIELACEKLNGTILAPGQEFSFNNVVGERTAAKGYGAAAAYNDGEVVQEIGGGICQVSSTLYNAVLRAGLKTTKRQSHTFSPNYVTPGMDATVSWGGPDYRFANVPAIAEYSNSESYSIGIKAHYADRTVTISIYGRPVLKDGYTYELSSKKVKNIPVVRKQIEPGSGRTPTKGSNGSQWTTNLVIKQDGKVISDKLDHKTFYSGHIEYYTEATTAAPTETPSETAPTDTPSETPAETLPPQPVTGPDGGPGVTAPQQTAPSNELSGNGLGSSAPGGTEAGSSAGGPGGGPGSSPDTGADTSGGPGSAPGSTPDSALPAGSGAAS